MRGGEHVGSADAARPGELGEGLFEQGGCGVSPQIGWGLGQRRDAAATLGLVGSWAGACSIKVA